MPSSPPPPKNGLDPQPINNARTSACFTMRMSYNSLRVELSQFCKLWMSASDLAVRRIEQRPERNRDRVPGVRNLHIPRSGLEELRVDRFRCDEHREIVGFVVCVVVCCCVDVAELDAIAADDLGVEQQRLGIFDEHLDESLLERPVRFLRND